jgi:NAD(P)-dependent dehydrogenase (short-subunit alcohol dehydrogenase family)
MFCRYFKDKTVLISGGSRGIGLSIAKKLAVDGANIVLAAKTATPHPNLPGTIYSAAKEIENAGGQCLPCIMDVRNEEQVERAVQATIDRFGKLDILINNASAVHMTGTVETPMKKFDLMNDVNVRGTFML